MRYRAALLYSILAATTVFVAVPGPATAAVPGFQVQITELPGRFAVGDDPSTVTVVASTDAGRQCQKVRWSMLLKVNGISLEHVTVDRIEDSRSFPLTIQTDGDTARLTDVQVDPGQLCPGRAVTARYRMSFSREVANGEVTLQAEAYDTTERLLQLATATRPVVNGDAPAEPGPTEEDPAEAGAAPGPSGDAIAAVPSSGTGGDQSLLGAGLIIGALLIFLGVGILLRLRMRNRGGDQAAPTQPYYPAM